MKHRRSTRLGIFESDGKSCYVCVWDERKLAVAMERIWGHLLVVGFSDSTIEHKMY